MDYNNYYGHSLKVLESIPRNGKVIYLVGDSILDNKFWVKEDYPVMRRPFIPVVKGRFNVPDVAYHVNSLTEEYMCINCAVEESKIESKLSEGLNDQDNFVRSNINTEDVLVVSIGGNDIMLSYSNIMNFIGGLIGFKRSYDNLLSLFRDGIQTYIKRLTELKTPRKIIVLFPYFPCEVPGECWASTAVNLMMPIKGRIKDLMKNIYNDLTYSPWELVKHSSFLQGEDKMSSFSRGEDISSSPREKETIKVPLYDIFDSTKDEDYVQRLEPSVKGGKKIAEKIIQIIS